MTAARYHTLRLLLGTQSEVAAMLGLHRVTIAKREAGTIPITTEAALAILALRNQAAERKKVVAVGAKRSATKRKKYNGQAHPTAAKTGVDGTENL
jgi:Helix-turn-helix